ncbi:hypothetical protein AYO40_01645 [Planctomycetaceae bacterium SCGC AG-212-D15]|nr:hypothetical protein AYO40_01645 [Planctomycetaceae bacterium SCGC AG-212-D15]
MAKWSQESAMDELVVLAEAANELSAQHPLSGEHTRWLIKTSSFLREVFGEASVFYATFAAIKWQHYGAVVTHVREMFEPWRAKERYDRPVYLSGLEMATGVLAAAAERLQKEGIDAVYEGKNTGPEASIVLRVIALAETKLRKVIRERPKREKEVQNAFEDLLVGADIPYSRETDAIEYSSKTYTPDFTIAQADLAIELKLCASATDEKLFIAQINDDILAYGTKYGNLFFVVYDCGFIRDADRFTSSFESGKAVCVRVVKH